MMIDVTGLVKSYGEVEALQGVSFSIKDGEVIGLLGPNGAGKTTLMKILTGYLHPTAGSAKIDGLEVVEHTEEVQERIGYLPENAPIYPELTVQSYLKMIADLRRIPQDQQKHRLSEAIHAVGLAERLTRPIGTLSKGYRQRVGLAQAILHKPKLLILDEPTNGLDPTQIVEVRHLIKKFSQNSTVMVSTHILSEVEATCDRMIIVIGGKVKADAKLSDLAATADAVVTLASKGKEDNVLAALTGLTGVKGSEIIRQEDELQTYRVHGDSDRDLCPDIYRIVKENDWPLWELRKDARTLEAVFNELAVAGGGGQ